MAKREKKESDYRPIIRALQTGEPARLYVLSGNDDWLLQDLIGRIRQQVLTAGAEGIDASVLDCGGRPSQLDIEQLMTDCMTLPFLSARRLILVRRSGVFQSGALDEARSARLMTLFEKLPDTACLIFAEEKVDKRQKKMMRSIESAGVLGEILHEQPAVLSGWIRKGLAQHGIAIDPVIAENLMDRCGLDMSQINQELSKLKHCCLGSGQKQVDLALLDALCIPDMRGTIFDITDAVSAGDTAGAMRLLHVLIDRREAPQMILFMLARHFKQLMFALDSENARQLAQQAGMLPFVAERLMRQCRRFSWAKLDALYAACFETDQNIKTGRLDELTALEILIAQAGRAARVR